MTAVDFDHHLRAESSRFLALVTGATADDLGRTVPTCPDWTVADLVWHLTEVQAFWAWIVAEGASSPKDYVEPERPSDDGLAEYFAGRTGALVAALERPDDDPCWSWSPLGGTIGWVRRRQAHEALIHRIDLELALDARSEVDESLAADGIDEMLTNMLDVGEVPPWAEFRPEDPSVVLDAGTNRWPMQLGRFVGTPPDGDPLDLPAVSLAAGRSVGAGPSVDGAAVVSGSASGLDLWLWGRGTAAELGIEGDTEVIGRIRATAADGTG